MLGNTRNILLLCTLVIGLAGCIRRQETVIVQPDGAVWLYTELVGDPEDVRQGDAAPSRQGGWTVAEHSEVDSEGEETLGLAAVKRVRPAAELPGTYARVKGPLHGLALAFPTSVEVEPRSDGTYFHFRRIYIGRVFAPIDYERKQVFESDRIKKITEKDPEKLTDEDRRTLADALLRFEASQAAIFVDWAAERVDPTPPQDVWLGVRSEVRRILDEPDWRKQIAEAIGQDNAGATIATIEEQARDRIDQTVRSTLRQNGMTSLTATRFLDAMDRARLEFEITEDLGDEEWEVSVVLPGKIIAHNAETDPVDYSPPFALTGDQKKFAELEPRLRRFKAELGEAAEAVTFQRLTWKFDGKALHDRDIRLMATSVIPRY